jgi:hypothetical protein
VVQSIDGTIGISWGVNFPKIPATPLSKSPSKMPAQRWSISQGVWLMLHVEFYNQLSVTLSHTIEICEL